MPTMDVMRSFVVSVVLAIGSLAWAQSPAGVTPVDQAVGDIDLLAKGLRVVEQGARQDGQQTSLFEATWLPPTLDGTSSTQPLTPLAPIQPTYYRVAPGFRARLNRMDYLIPTGRKSFTTNITPLRDGVFLELVPANTVFELSQPPWTGAGGLPGAGPTQPGPIDYRLDLRIDRRIEARVDRAARTSANP